MNNRWLYVIPKKRLKPAAKTKNRKHKALGKNLVTFIFPLLMFAVSVQNTEACFSIVAGKSATADGSVLLGHNEDNGSDDVAGMRKMERTPHGPDEWAILSKSGNKYKRTETCGYLSISMTHIAIPYCVLNEHGVAVTSNLCSSREDKPEITDGGIGEPMLRRLVAKQAKTAREAVEMVGSLVERFGYTSVGRTMLICDPNEGWLLGLVKGKHWVATRVPDDEVAFLSNTYSIHEIDLNDKANYRGSPGLVDYAIKRGWYAPEEGPFDFEKAYAFPPTRVHDCNLNRLWSAMSRISAEKIPLPETQNIPFSIKPKSKLSVETLFSILRDHYEGTPVWQMDPGNDITPHNGPFTVCNHDTNYSSVYQLRSHMPAGIGALWWLSMWAPCTSPYIPIYQGMDGISPDLGFKTNQNGVPTGYGPAYGTFHSLRDWAHKDFVGRNVSLWEMWYRLENAALEMQEILEKQAMEKWGENREHSREILSLFSKGALLRAMEQAESILKREDPGSVR